MIHDLWLVLTRRLTKRKLDLCDDLCLRLAHDLQHKETLIKALTLPRAAITMSLGAIASTERRGPNATSPHKIHRSGINPEHNCPRLLRAAI